jgi:hypothetical protein
MATVGDVLRMAFTQYGHTYSGEFDSVNGNHPWAYWCLSYVDSSVRNNNISVPLYPNAVTAGDAYPLSSGVAPPGAAVFLDENFYWPDGHAALAIGGGWCLSTVTDGTGVGLMFLPPETTGMMGWAYYDGVTVDTTPSPPPADWYVQPNNPYQQEGEPEIGIGGGMLRMYNSVALSQEPFTIYGFALAREEDAYVSDADGTTNFRTIQRFERCVLVSQPDTPFPFDVVVMPRSSTIAPP